MHPAVDDVAVVGKPDAALGERVAAFVVLKRGVSATAGELQVFAAARIAAYKVPEIYLFVSELPRGSTGKVHRKTLKEWVVNPLPETVEVRVQTSG
jgi:long-chain acyl-CoA synthetase